MSKVAQYQKVADAIDADLRRQGRGPGDKLPNVRDLAKDHRVSVFTVSRALQVLETRGLIDRRWAVGCFLSEKSRELPGAKEHPTLGILLDPHRTPTEGWSHEMLEGLLTQIQASGAKPTYVSWSEDLVPSGELDGLIVDALLVDEAKDPPRARKIRDWIRNAAASRFPLVVVDFDLPEAASVQIDNEGGGAQAGRYLVQLGHREIAYMGAERNPNSEERLAGIRKAVVGAGLPYDESLVWRTIPSPRVALREFAGRYRARPFSATCCFDDNTAAGVVKAAETMGLRVPRDLSVIGFGNLASGEYSSLSLTTIDVQQQELTRATVRLLRDLIREPKSRPVKLRIPTQLIVRESTGPAPKEIRS